jgi:predicted PurR-regulated permease PerM
MGKGLDLAPLVVVLSLFFWGWVLGPVGILLSIPLTMMVKDILLESGDDARWLADLMGQGEIPDREPADDA